MSMPEFPKSKTILTREEAINAILTSIAMEETALSHILNAEGEKIQFAIEHIKKSDGNNDLQMLLKVNKSAASIIDQISDIQIILKNKMRLVLGSLPQRSFHSPECTEHKHEPSDPGTPLKPGKPCKPQIPEPCPPCEPQISEPCPPCEPQISEPCPEPQIQEPCPPSEPQIQEPCPPNEPQISEPNLPCEPQIPEPCKDRKRPAFIVPYRTAESNGLNPPVMSKARSRYAYRCTSMFTAKAKYVWTCGSTLDLNKSPNCGNGILLCRIHRDSLILLPAGKTFKIEFELELSKKISRLLTVELKLNYGSKIIKSKTYACNCDKYNICLTDKLIWNTPYLRKDSVLAMRLVSPEKTAVNYGVIMITEL